MAVYKRDDHKSAPWWVTYSVRGKRYREKGGTGRTRKGAEAYLAEIHRQIAAGTWVAPKDRPRVSSFDRYAHSIIDRRAERGIKGAKKDERTHVTKHLEPIFGAMPITESLGDFQVVRDGFGRLKAKGLASRTLRNVWSTFRAIQVEAAEEGVILALPPPLTVGRGHLPPPEDSAGFDRDRAVFTRDELSQLLSCDDVPGHRRIMYAVYAMTGARQGEVLPMRVNHFEPWRDNLPGLVLPAEKTGRFGGDGWRLVPVHPTLQAWLEWWLDGEYQAVHGRKPTDGSLLFPTASNRRKGAGETLISANEIYKRWKFHDLPAAGLEHRRMHDMRRSFISIARSSRVDDRLVRSVTHRYVKDRVLEMYTTYEWAALCDAIGGIDFRLPGPPGSGAKVVSLDRRRGR